MGFWARFSSLSFSNGPIFNKKEQDLLIEFIR